MRGETAGSGMAVGPEGRCWDGWVCYIHCAINGLDRGGRRVREEFEKRRGLALGGGCVRSSFYFVCKVCIVSKALITRLDYHFLDFIVCRASRVLMT